MRKDFGAKPYTYPQPVLMIATYGEDGKPDVMNAAWGGISDDKEISICVSENHKTTENILKKGAFTVSMADVEHMTACDYVGIVSGNKEPDKFVKAGFTAEKSEKVDAPIIKELPICIECKLKSYDKDTCRLIGEIVNVSVDESVLDENGNVDVAKAAPITFDPFNNASALFMPPAMISRRESEDLAIDNSGKYLRRSVSDGDIYSESHIHRILSTISVSERD